MKITRPSASLIIATFISATLIAMAILLFDSMPEKIALIILSAGTLCSAVVAFIRHDGFDSAPYGYASAATLIIGSLPLLTSANNRALGIAFIVGAIMLVVRILFERKTT